MHIYHQKRKTRDKSNAILPQGAVEALRRNDLVDGMVVAASGATLFISIMPCCSLKLEMKIKIKIGLIFVFSQ